MTNFRNSSVVINDEVANALEEGGNVVALETTIVVHGLPSPVNLEVAEECESAVREGGSVPATIGVLDGHVIVGLSAPKLRALADPDRHANKLSARDLGLALANHGDGATTVAGTIAVASRVGIRVMATGGLGGVHRDVRDSFDESADLTALSRNQVLVVASGVKSILDIGATLERLDTLGVPVVGYRTDKFPVSTNERAASHSTGHSLTRLRPPRRSSLTATCRRPVSSSPIRSTPRANSPWSCTTARSRARSTEPGRSA